MPRKRKAPAEQRAEAGKGEQKKKKKKQTAEKKAPIWRQARVNSRAVSISGGYCSTAELASAMEYHENGQDHVFVKLDKNAKWFLRAVGGTSAHKGSLKAVQVNDMLQDLVTDHLRFQQDTARGVAPGASADEDVDPMDELPELRKETVRPLKKRADETRARARPQVLELIVPTLPPCAPGQQPPSTTSVRVYRPTMKAGQRLNCWLRADCMDWLLTYAAAELKYQGIAPVEESESPDSAPAGGTGMTGTASNYTIEYDFSEKAYAATCQHGPNQGTVRRLRVNAVTQSMWQALQKRTLFCTANQYKLKEAAYEGICLWCSAIDSGEEPQFKKAMGLCRPLTGGGGQEGTHGGTHTVLAGQNEAEDDGDDDEDDDDDDASHADDVAGASSGTEEDSSSAAGDDDPREEPEKAGN